MNRVPRWVGPLIFFAVLLVAYIAAEMDGERRNIALRKLATKAINAANVSAATSNADADMSPSKSCECPPTPTLPTSGAPSKTDPPPAKTNECILPTLSPQWALERDVELCLALACPLPKWAEQYRALDPLHELAQQYTLVQPYAICLLRMHDWLATHRPATDQLTCIAGEVEERFSCQAGEFERVLSRIVKLKEPVAAETFCGGRSGCGAMPVFRVVTQLNDYLNVFGRDIDAIGLKPQTLKKTYVRRVREAYQEFTAARNVKIKKQLQAFLCDDLADREGKPNHDLTAAEQAMLDCGRKTPPSTPLPPAPKTIDL
ncbi:MAG: hypothetical protein HW383_208 [Candidatus Magasanikbacteria bacterium]|nr:hypothetical protein [Candidatus Magasanikbacteria bacterium]